MKLQITIDGRVYEAEVEILEDDDLSPRSPAYAPYQPAPLAAPSIPFSGTHAQSQEPEDGADEEKVCRSPVRGLVIKVNVEPGQAVEANELIVVLEAMKMETNVTAHRAGIVKSVSVAPGDSVKVNQIVVEFE